MKNILLLLFLVFCNTVFSQTKRDTLYLEYNETIFKKSAENTLKELLEINQYLHNVMGIDTVYSAPLFRGSLEEREFINLPILHFSDKILSYEGGETDLLQYLDFEISPSAQEIFVFNDNFITYSINISEFDSTKIKQQARRNMLYEIDRFLFIESSNKPIGLDVIDVIYYLCKDNFSFVILDEYCVALKGKVYLVRNISGRITFVEFNDYFGERIDIIKGKVIGKRDGRYKLN